MKKFYFVWQASAVVGKRAGKIAKIAEKKRYLNELLNAKEKIH